MWSRMALEERAVSKLSQERAAPIARAALGARAVLEDRAALEALVALEDHGVRELYVAREDHASRVRHARYAS